MKKVIFLSLFILSAFSCKHVWNEDDKAAFYQACTEEAIKWAGTQETAKTYCDCVFRKMNEKYPTEEEVLMHIDVLAKDTDLINCKDEILNAQKH